MTKLNADMKAIIRGTILCFAATTNVDGSPNLSPKSTLSVHDDDHLLFADIASPGTVANLQRDPRIEINCIDIFARRGYRFKGTAEVLSKGNPIYDALAASVRAAYQGAIPVHHAVLVEVHAVKPILSPAYTYIAGTTEEGLRETYAQKYGMAPLPSFETA